MPVSVFIITLLLFNQIGVITEAACIAGSSPTLHTSRLR
ncbi:putative membrane protein [Escherichia coli 1-392-07_S3_C1]|nr:putative membrane protein [Escherichia coli 1-392-07_S3_C3]KDW51749.1 putative membrane protein [Escherichia coli 1-392-07_S3_C2]KDW98883.1 putative membrane protein [Escherichia coli 1-392-07_S3_C1]